MLKFSRLLLLAFLLATSTCLPQQSASDSLLNTLKSTKSDTSRIKTLNLLANEFKNTGDYDKAIQYSEKALALEISSREKNTNEEFFINSIAQSESILGSVYLYKGEYLQSLQHFTTSLDLFEKNNNRKGIASSLAGIGSVYSEKGDHQKALDHYLKCMKIQQEIGDRSGLADVYNNIGSIYDDRGDFADAITYYFKALKIDEAMGNKSNIAGSYVNIGVVHREKGEYDKAIEYYLKAFKIDRELNDKRSMAFDNNNIGSAMYYKGQPDSAIAYFKKSLQLMTEIGDKKGIAKSYSNIGNILSDKGNYQDAMSNYLTSLKIREDIGDKTGEAIIYNNIGSLFLRQHKGQEAKTALLKSLALAKELNEKPQLMDAYIWLTRADSMLGNYKSAFEYHKLFMSTRDSIFNEESNKKTLEAEMNFEFEKKEQAIKLENEKKEAIAKEEIDKQTMQRNGFIGGFVLMLSLAGVSYRNFRNKKRSHALLETKNIIIEEKNKDILDSINYAKRLQQAILPSTNMIREYLPDSFILYKPKDIVAGDFYWMAVKDGLILIAACDCTGHGVPGAMVSVVCSNALNRTVKEFGITDPGKILDKVTDLVLETFENSENEVSDGMDISLCVINKNTKEVLWSGAHNPLWISTKNKDEITEIKADKQPVGKFAGRKAFTTHRLKLSADDTLYLFSDGYVDQFGGNDGKKFRTGNLKKLLLSIQDKSIDDQKNILEESFESWKGNLEQVDDVCVIGLKL
ncbi:MAG: hypothetical protein K0Q95_3048 [Bacteroidota bacterium]|jgi:tetratricopeptide (TPR) repeat protein/serine phosphatase RsbU (regulator of sigma subunit)|nr:hypothetical protein [Bacteroidota bacterium]